MTRTPAPYPAFDGSQNCAGTSTETWFNEEGKPGYDALPIMQRICSDCAFIEPCLEYALHHTVYGVWAGTTENVRRQIRRRRNIIPINLEARAS